MPIYADGSFGVGTTEDAGNKQQLNYTRKSDSFYDEEDYLERQLDINGPVDKMLSSANIGDSIEYTDKSGKKHTFVYESDDKDYKPKDHRRQQWIEQEAKAKGKPYINTRDDILGGLEDTISKNKYDWNKAKVFFTKKSDSTKKAKPVSKNAKYDTSRSKGTKKKKPSSLEAFKENARQFNDALNEATKQGALEVEFTDITGKTFHRWWNGGAWSDRKIVQDMAKRYSKKSGKFKSSFKKPKDWE